MKEIGGTGQNWWRWLFPRPIEWVTLFLYAAVLAVYNNFVILGVYQIEYPWLGNLAILLGIVFFILLDRLEYWRYKEKLSWRLNGLFLLVRYFGIVIISFSDGLARSKITSPIFSAGWGCGTGPRAPSLPERTS